MTDTEKAIRWFENIAYECDKLTSGNVAHLRTQIKGMAIRSTEYLKKHALVSEDLDEAAMMHFKDVLERKIKTGLETANMTSFKAGAEWQKEQMMKDAVDGWVARDKDGDIAIFREAPTKDAEIGMWKPCKSAYIFPSKDEYPDVTWDSEPQKVKVIIIKE